MTPNVTAALALVAMLGASSVFACDGLPAATDAALTPPPVAAKAPPAKTAKVAHNRGWVSCVGNDCARAVATACEGKACTEQPITR
jgi:hypothetical protein